MLMKIAAALLIAAAALVETATAQSLTSSTSTRKPAVQTDDANDFVGIVRPTKAGTCRVVGGMSACPYCDNDFEFRVQVQFYRTIPGQPGVYSVHGPYPYVRERFADGVRTLYYSDGNAGEVALATMTTLDGWEIVGDPSGLWDVLTVIPNES